VTGRVQAVAAAAVAGAVLAGTLTVPARADDTVPAVERVLVVSLPALSWADIRDADVPALRAFVERAAVANLAHRIGRRTATIGDAYVTIGAGTRARALGAGLAFEVEEPYGASPAGEVFTRRTGRAPSGELVYLDLADLERANDRTGYDARPGALGDELAAHGVGRAVVANADLGREQGVDAQYRRWAATALMDSRGEVPGGALGAARLLRDDPVAPWGVRLDGRRIAAELDAAWRGPGPKVVLVEASDLVRAEEYRGRATPARSAEHRAHALAAADALVGLLDDVDPARDAVAVLAPVAHGADADLSLVALAAPGMEPGLLRSATTRRDGFVQLVDVGPTILSLFGIDVPAHMEGRPLERRSYGTSAAERIDHLVAVARAAEVRDGAIVWASALLTAVVVALAAAFALRRFLPPRVAGALPAVAVVILAVIPATYLAAIGPEARSTARLALAVAVPTAAIAAGLEVLRRRRPVAAVAVALAIIAGLLGADLLAGAHLQLNTLFGYSAAVAGRFAGLGNLAFGFFAAATLMLAVTVRQLVGGRRGTRVAIVVLVAGVLLDGLPMLGADVGGTMAMVPAFGVAAMLLAGRRVRAPHVVAWFVAAGSVVAAFALLDLARPEDDRTHLARFFERVDEDGWRYVTDLASRRWDASFGDTRTVLWVAFAVVAIGVAVYAFVPGLPRRMLLGVEGRAGAVGLAMLATVGLVANDSGLAVPGVMLAVGVPVLVLRGGRWRDTEWSV
jgi:hypothetical protein